jgi:hypothetical protein
MTTYYPNTKFTLLDRAKTTADGKTVLPVIQVMNLGGVDDFYKDVPFQECNMGISHRIVRDTGMVESNNRKLNAGTKSSKLNTQVVDETTQMKERWRKIDEVELAGITNIKTKLDGEDRAHMRKLGEDTVKAIFSGAEGVVGLLQRLSTLNPTGLNNVQSNGHTSASSTTRIIIVEWSTEAKGGCYCLYPTKGSYNTANTTLGVFAKDWGFAPGADENDSTKELVYARAQFQAWTGVAVENNKKIACLANINPSLTGSNNFADGCVSRLISLIEEGQFNPQKSRIYVNTTIKAQMNIYAEGKSNTIWGTDEIFGRPVRTFQDIPIRTLDKAIISNTQEVVT